MIKQTVCCFSVLWLLCATSSANVCVYETVTVSQIQGRANYVPRPGLQEQPAGTVRVQVWKTDRTGQRVRIAEGETDWAGLFSLPNIPSGLYEIEFVSAIAHEFSRF